MHSMAAAAAERCLAARPGAISPQGVHQPLVPLAKMALRCKIPTGYSWNLHVAREHLPRAQSRSMASSGINVFRRSEMRAIPVAQASRGCSTKPPTSKTPQVDSTLLFRATNPELMLDPSKRTSWKWPLAVVAFFSAYFTYLYLFEDVSTDGPPPVPEDVHKVLDDGRWLMKDGSIRARGGQERSQISAKKGE